MRVHAHFTRSVFKKYFTLSIPPAGHSEDQAFFHLTTGAAPQTTMNSAAASIVEALSGLEAKAVLAREIFEAIGEHGLSSLGFDDNMWASFKDDKGASELVEECCDAYSLEPVLDCFDDTECMLPESRYEMVGEILDEFLQYDCTPREVIVEEGGGMSNEEFDARYDSVAALLISEQLTYLPATALLMDLYRARRVATRSEEAASR